MATTEAATAGQTVLDRTANRELAAWTRKLVQAGSHRWLFDPNVDGVVGLCPTGQPRAEGDPPRAVVVVYLDGEDFEHDDVAFWDWRTEYRRAYERGWRYSRRSIAGLAWLDAKNAPDAEYDGYLDYAAGREKWHLLHCADHDRCP